MGQAEGRPYEMAHGENSRTVLLAPFYLQRCPLHSCQVDRIEKCPSTKSAACGLRNPYPVSVWCNSVTPCIYCTSVDKSSRKRGQVVKVINGVQWGKKVYSSLFIWIMIIQETEPFNTTLFIQ